MLRVNGQRNADAALRCEAKLKLAGGAPAVVTYVDVQPVCDFTLP